MQLNETTPTDKTNSNASRNISQDMRSIKENGAHIAETVLEQGQDKYEQLKLSSARYIKMLEREVAEKPVQSMAIALGAGMVLSFLLRRG